MEAVPVQEFRISLAQPVRSRKKHGASHLQEHQKGRKSEGLTEGHPLIKPEFKNDATLCFFKSL